MSPKTVSRSPGYALAGAHLTEAIEADCHFHGVPNPFELLGFTDAKVARLRIGASDWTLTDLGRVAHLLRPSDPVSLIVDWSRWHSDEMKRLTRD